MSVSGPSRVPDSRRQRPPARRRPPAPGQIARRRWVALGLGGLIALIVIRTLVGGGVQPPPVPGLANAGAAGSGAAFRYHPGGDSAYAARATAGSAQVIYTKSPGGVLATAARVGRFKQLIATAVRGTAIPANLLEGLVFVESAGRPDVIAGQSAADAVGLTQILASTGQDLLGMRIDLPRSERLTAQIAQAESRGQPGRVGALERRRAQIDQRFDPKAELAATVRYLEIALHDLGGRVDLAITAYHSGIGNLQQVLAAYDGGQTVSYTQLYFDTSPAHQPAAYNILYGLGDDSSLYYWRVLGAVRIMSLYRSDRAALERLNILQNAYPSNAEVLVPPDSGASFADAQALSDAYSSRTLIPLPRNAAAFHLAYASAMGSHARKLGVPVGLYHGLRPAALTVLLAIADEVHALAPRGRPLTVTGTVVDRHYLSTLSIADPPAATGYTFAIQRKYSSAAQAAAFQFVLDRLQALDAIAWTRTPLTIEITAAPDARSVIARGV